MAISAPQYPIEQQAPQKEEQSFWDKLLMGLNVAKAGTGITADVMGIQKTNNENALLNKQNKMLGNETTYNPMQARLNGYYS